MSDEAKLGMVAGVLAVVGVAVFGFPADRPAAAARPAPPAVAGAPPSLPPAAVQVPAGASR